MVKCFFLTYFLIGEPEAVGAIGAYAPEGSRNGECGLRPVGAIGAYAPEGSGKEKKLIAYSSY